MAGEPPTLTPLSASLGVRPARAGVFVPVVPDLGWQTMFAGALSAPTRFWVGSQSLVFPLTDAWVHKYQSCCKSAVSRSPAEFVHPTRLIALLAEGLILVSKGLVPT